jgi:hypothetical protein
MQLNESGDIFKIQETQNSQKKINLGVREYSIRQRIFENIL